MNEQLIKQLMAQNEAMIAQNNAIIAQMVGNSKVNDTLPELENVQPETTETAVNYDFPVGDTIPTKGTLVTDSDRAKYGLKFDISDQNTWSKVSIRSLPMWGTNPETNRPYPVNGKHNDLRNLANKIDLPNRSQWKNKHEKHDGLTLTDAILVKLNMTDNKPQQNSTVVNLPPVTGERPKKVSFNTDDNPKPTKAIWQALHAYKVARHEFTIANGGLIRKLWNVATKRDWRSFAKLVRENIGAQPCACILPYRSCYVAKGKIPALEVGKPKEGKPAWYYVKASDERETPATENVHGNILQ